MRKLPILIILLALSTAEGDALEAIVIRHDRQDAAYRELAQHYPMVCRVGGGMGTLVEPDWIVTAAHVAETVTGGEVRCGDQTAKVERVFLHPDYAVEGAHRDIALLRLATPMKGVDVARLYGEDDELGETMVFVGDGRTGTGISGPVEGERTLRAARNTVSGVRPGWLEFVFDEPPAGEDLEGISGPGDSGGPALLEKEGQIYVLGVSAYNDGGDLCTYGTTEHYTRVSDERTWLDDVIGGRSTATSERRVLQHETRSDGQRTVRSEEVREVGVEADLARATERVASALIDAIHAGDREAFSEQFNDAFRKREGEIDSMFDFMMGARELHGDITSIHRLDVRGLAIEDADQPMVPVVWHFENGMPGYFGIALDGDGQIDHFSLFVRRDICRNGSVCPLSVPVEG